MRKEYSPGEEFITSTAIFIFSILIAGTAWPKLSLLFIGYFSITFPLAIFFASDAYDKEAIDYRGLWLVNFYLTPIAGTLFKGMFRDKDSL